jgi:hypothetical protein
MAEGPDVGSSGGSDWSDRFCGEELSGVGIFGPGEA